MDDYTKYQTDVTDDIKTCIDSMGCQPILFVGSGLTKRYINGPSWIELLFQLSEQCPQIDKKFAYYQQRYPDLIDIGSEFSEKYNDWAWGDGEAEFPEELFDTGNDASIYLKHKSM